MKVLHVIGKEMEEISPKSGDRYELNDGDVYVIDNGNDIYIWIGKDCSVDEKTVGAWVANQIDNEERGGEPSVTTVTQGNEPDDLKNLVEFDVVDKDTPGFLKRAELDKVEYKLYRVFIKEDTASIDDADIEEVNMDRKSLTSEDVYVLDGNDQIFTFIGKDSQREEKFEGQRLMQKIDSDRDYIPLSYTIYEGEGSKSENAFYEMIEKAKSTKGSVVSVEDQRELKYRPEEEGSGSTESTMDDRSEPEEEKKGFFSKLFSFFR